MMPKILVTNDDGVYGPGIHAAINSIADMGEVTVVAPSMQQSGVGRAVSIFEPLRITEVETNGRMAYSVGGTPTDAVILGIFSVMKELPDLAISGFNIGENVSTDCVTTSGTIGAALEAASYGVPSIAVSIQVEEQGDKFADIREYEHDFEVGEQLVNKIARHILQHGVPSGVDVININIPHHVDDDTQVEVTRLARKIFDTSVEERKDPRGRPYYWIDGGLLTDAAPGTDVHAVFQNENISVTPLSLDSTSPLDLGELESMF